MAFALTKPLCPDLVVVTVTPLIVLLVVTTEPPLPECTDTELETESETDAAKADPPDNKHNDTTSSCFIVGPNLIGLQSKAYEGRFQKQAVS